MGYIYKITNKINGKVYIGQTIRNISYRWEEHLRCSNNSKRDKCEYPLYRAIRKYGKENFIIDKIETCDIKILDEREIFWIDFYNSYDKNYGYNQTRGGRGTRHIEYDEIFLRYDNGESPAEISEHMHISRSNLYQILKGYKNYDRNIVWERSKKYLSKKKGTPIRQYDLDGNFIAEYASSKAAARVVAETTARNISKSCQLKNCLSGNFQWRYATDEPPEKYNGRLRYMNKKVYRFDINLNLIKIYESVSQAARETGFDRAAISKCCNGNKNYKTVGNFIWSYSNIATEVA